MPIDIRPAVPDDADTILRFIRELAEYAREYLDAPEGPLPDADLRDRITQVELDSLCYKATMRRSTEAAKAGLERTPAN